MAKRKGRNFRRYLRGSIDHDLTFAALGANDVVLSALADTVVDTTWLSSVKATWTLSNLTNTTSAGPFLVGLAHSDYTAAEIEEWIENADSWKESNMIGKEISRRKIRRVGSFRQRDTDQNDVLQYYVLNEGRLVHTKCNWLINEGQTVKVWIYNTGTSPVAVSTPVLRVNGHANLWPK